MEWDAIVIGSGMGGLTAAAALARCDKRVLVLEQHFVLGGMTQTFERQGLRFATGLHYIGGVGPQPGGAGSFGRLLGWLGDGTLKFAPLPDHFDTVRLRDTTQPGGEFSFTFGAPESDNIARLKALFPDEVEGLDRYARDFKQATRAARQMFALHGLPKPVGTVMSWIKGGGMREAAQRTLAQALADIGNPTLRKLLGARGGDYGLPPAEAPLMVHATVIGSYTHGAWYPVGGPQRFAESLGATVRAAGGELRTSAAVAGIEIERGRACGVRLQSGEGERAPAIVSAMGAANTARALPSDAAPGWQAEIGTLKPSGTYVALFLGFEGDIRTAVRTTGSMKPPPAPMRWTGTTRPGPTRPRCSCPSARSTTRRTPAASPPNCWRPAAGRCSTAGKTRTWAHAPKTTKPPSRGLRIACWPSSSGCSRPWPIAWCSTNWPRRCRTPPTPTRPGARCTACA